MGAPNGAGRPSSAASSLVTKPSAQPTNQPDKSRPLNATAITLTRAGIDTRINYVANGQLNTYPLGFTIPMGYHLSDMIFTWQNLGQTNVSVCA